MLCLFFALFYAPVCVAENKKLPQQLWQESSLIELIKEQRHSDLEQALAHGRCPDGIMGPTQSLAPTSLGTSGSSDSGVETANLATPSSSNEFVQEIATLNGLSPLWTAIQLRDVISLKLLLDYGADASELGPEGQPPLAWATTLGDYQLVDVLIRNGVPADTPLAFPTVAKFRGYFKPSWLKEQLVLDKGITPLMIAAAQGDEMMIQLLMNLGAESQKRSRRYKMYPYSFAVNEHHTRIIQRLVGRDPDRPQSRVIVKLNNQRAQILKDGKVILNTAVSTGRKEFRTPPGTYVVTSKHPVWRSTIYEVPMPWLCRLNGSPIGLHEGVVPGYPASHGCIRVPRGTAERVFNLLKIGDTVSIVP